MESERDAIAAYNERVKLFAGFINALALGMIGFAVLRPLADSLSNVSSATVWWMGTGLALHGVAHYILGRLRREVRS